MKNFIEELYYGNINPQERYFDRKSKTGKSILAIADVEDSLNEVYMMKSAQPHKIAHRRLSQHFGPGKKDQRRIAVQVRRQCAEQAARDAEPHSFSWRPHCGGRLSRQIHPVESPGTGGL